MYTAKIGWGANDVTLTTGVSGGTPVAIFSDATGSIDISSAPACWSYGGGAAACPLASVSLADIRTANGDDTVQNLSSIPARVFLGTGNDTAIGGFGTEYFYNEGGADSYTGNGGIDRIDNELDYGPVTVAPGVVGGSGQAGEGDTVATDIEEIYGGQYADVLTGTSADNVINGREGDDVLNGAGGNDSLDGSSGNDRLMDSAGSDVYSSGGGSDTLDFGNRSAALTWDASTSSGTIVGSGETDTNVGGTITTIAGTPYNDVIQAGANFYVAGRGGADQLTGALGAETLDGGDGDDTLVGAGASDSLLGGNGADTLSGTTGNDRFIDSPGADSYTGGGGFDTIDYANATSGITYPLIPGNASSIGFGGVQDTIAGVTTIAGSAFADTITAGSGFYINGRNGSDTLNGGPGSETLVGGDGNDTINSSGDGNADDVQCGGGTDLYRVDGGLDTASACETVF